MDLPVILCVILIGIPQTNQPFWRKKRKNGWIYRPLCVHELSAIMWFLYEKRKKRITQTVKESIEWKERKEKEKERIYRPFILCCARKEKALDWPFMQPWIDQSIIWNVLWLCSLWVIIYSRGHHCCLWLSYYIHDSRG